MERERFIWDNAEKMFGAGSCAPVEELDMAERLMRKRVLASLQEMAGELESEIIAHAGNGCGGRDGGSPTELRRSCHRFNGCSLVQRWWRGSARRT